VALPHAFQALPIWAVIGAGRGRYSVACYTAELGAIRRTGNYALVNPPGLVDLVLRVGWQDHDNLAARTFFAGEIDASLAGLLAERLGERAILARPSMNLRRAGFLAELAWARWTRGEADDMAALAPMYMPHESVEGSVGSKK
jgi:tRNA threonylcarbamoyladenosine biosynthesis protein TsaB